MAEFLRACGCRLAWECPTAERLFAEAREAWATGGLAPYAAALQRWSDHRAGRAFCPDVPADDSRGEPSTLALLEKSVACRTIPPAGLRDDESQSADDLRSFPPRSCPACHDLPGNGRCPLCHGKRGEEVGR